MSMVNLKTMTLEKVIPIARGEQVFSNETLPVGTCFVPRILQKDDKTLRCYFASEHPKKRQAQTWYIDFDLATQSFTNEIHRVKLKTAAGNFDMQPQYFHNDAVAQGFTRPPRDYGMYLFDSFKPFDGKTYVAINDYRGRPERFGGDESRPRHRRSPRSLQRARRPDAHGIGSESTARRHLDGDRSSGVRRQELHLQHKQRRANLDQERTRAFVANGTSSKPTFDRFGDLYY